MTLMARYSGTCGECGGRYQPGELIRSDGEDFAGMTSWAHAVCPDDDPLEPRQPVCPVCWLTHPEGACDR